MSEKLPWFRCRPDRLLGALAGMPPDCGYLYTVLLMRIYEHGGPVPETEVTLSRRTGLSSKRVREALAWLVDAAKILKLENGRLDSETTHEELSWQHDRSQQATKAGKTSAKKRGQKTQQIQRNEPTAVQQRLNHIDRDKEREEREEKDTSYPKRKRNRWPDGSFDRIWAAYPNKVGKKAAFDKLAMIERDGEATPDQIVAGIERYKADKPKHHDWKHPLTWLNQGCWLDEYAPPVATAPQMNGFHRQPVDLAAEADAIRALVKEGKTENAQRH